MTTEQRNIETTIKKACAVILTLSAWYIICHVIHHLTKI